jgi:hypothetical protein
MRDSVIFLTSVFGFMIIFFATMLIDLRDYYEQRFQVIFCDDREPVNFFLISKDIINTRGVKTETREKTSKHNYTTYSITPTLEFFDRNTNQYYKFINVCEIVELQPPKLHVMKK